MLQKMQTLNVRTFEILFSIIKQQLGNPGILSATHFIKFNEKTLKKRHQNPHQLQS